MEKRSFNVIIMYKRDIQSLQIELVEATETLRRAFLQNNL